MLVVGQGKLVEVVLDTLVQLGSHLEVVHILLLVVVPLLLDNLQLVGDRQVGLGIQGLHDVPFHDVLPLDSHELHGLHMALHQDTCPVKY